MSLNPRYPPADKGRVVLWGLLGNSPFGGMTWQVLHHLVGLRRLGFDVWYVEDSDTPSLRPGDLELSDDESVNALWIERALAPVGLADRWILRLPWREETLGHPRSELDRLYREADAVFNLCGAHWVLDRHDAINTLVLLETDPVSLQVHLASRDPVLVEQVNRYSHLFTYGQNIGRRDCPIPAGEWDWLPTRPPVVVDWWEDGSPGASAAMTTVASWGDHGAGKDVTVDGVTYRWRRDVAFEPYVGLPSRTSLALEMAVSDLEAAQERRLREAGWRLSPAEALLDPAAYRAYIRGSLGEFTVAKEQYARTHSGWMSDRSVCYLAAGRPVVSQSTGAEPYVPVDEGLLTFSDPDGASAALEQIAADPALQGARAHDVACEYFAAERVLGDVCRRIGLL